MPVLSTVQKNQIARFIAKTDLASKDKRTAEKLAERYLRNAGFDFEKAYATYYGASLVSDQELKAQFESLRDPAEDEPDTIGPNGAMNYLTSIGVNLEDASLFVALQIIKAESLGEIKKEGFVSGWKETNVTPSIPSQKSYLATVVSNLSNSPDSFKKVYRHTFDAGKEGGQRALTLDNALIYWDMLFKSPGLAWVGKQSQLDWFAQWTAFLKEKYSRTVSKDMWNMTLEFALKSIEDESLSFWSEDGAWPGVIDDFVAWYRAKSPGAAMDVDA